MPKGSDNSWAGKLYSKCGKSKHFEKPRFGTSSFLIHHFADRVQYEATGFLEKNRDTVIEEQVDVLRNGDVRKMHNDFYTEKSLEHVSTYIFFVFFQNKLLKKLFSDEDPKLVVPNVRVKVSAQKPVLSTPKQNKKTVSLTRREIEIERERILIANLSRDKFLINRQYKICTKFFQVGSQFRDSLNMLMSTLNATTPHYVRCIKPNDSKEAFEYNPVRAVQQLRACGVLETIRISAAGFPSQRTYNEFFLRYRCLCKFKDIRRDDLKETSRRILGRFVPRRYLPSTVLLILSPFDFDRIEKRTK